MTDRDADLDALEAKALKAHETCDHAESWEWVRAYGMGREDGGEDKHWCLVDPDDASRTLDLFTVTLCSQEDSGLSGAERFCDAPVPAHIAACSPDFILALIRRVRDLEQQVEAERFVHRSCSPDDPTGVRNAARIRAAEARADRAEAAAAGMRAALEKARFALKEVSDHTCCRHIDCDQCDTINLRVVALRPDIDAALISSAGARVAAVVSAAEVLVAAPFCTEKEAKAEEALNAAVDALHAERGTG